VALSLMKESAPMLKAILLGAATSVALTYGTLALDEQVAYRGTAACMYALQHEVLAAQGIPIQGVGRQAYRS
jgi:hypothetical protein